ncbi:MAG: MFS transporter [Chloroflexota bacterium]|nr:MFS transporter [Chloroflexota bacterium]
MIQSWHWTTFDALQDRNFRWLWVGRLASSTTFQIGGVAQGWLVYQLTGSAFALGWVSIGWSVSTLLLSLYGGAIADRVEKRDLLIWTRLAMLLNTLAIALLISLDVIRIWHLMVNSLLTGICFSFMMPAQQAIVPELVGREALLNAISLNSVGMGLMGILFASLAGYLVEVAGVAGAYYLMGGCHLVTFLTLMRIPRTGRGESFRHLGESEFLASVWTDLREGVRYIGARPAIKVLLGLTLARVLFSVPYRTFMPKFAQDVMGMDASGLGVLMAAPGVGALISSLATASLGDFQGKGKLFLASGMIMGGALLPFVSTSSFALVLLCLVLVGAASNACMVTNNTLIQTNSHDHVRGRVMSVYMMMWGLTPLGTLPAGAIADRMGVPFVVGLEGGMLVLVFLGVGWLWPRIRRLE